MKQSNIIWGIRFAFTGLLLTAMQGLVYAQEKAIEINEAEVGSWFERNWKWVAGGVILLLLIVLFSGSSTRRKTTTVVRKDDFGNVKSVTTTETVE